VTRSHRPTASFRGSLSVRAPFAFHVTKLICWGKCWGKKPRSMRNRFSINDLASADGGVDLRLFVIGSPGHSHDLNAQSLGLALVLVMVI
jgi:hypothetical protein